MTSPQDHLARFFADLTEAAAGCVNKEAEGLTEKEIVALAWLSGCRMESEWEHNRFVFRAKGGVGVVKINGKFVVGQNPDLTFPLRRGGDL